VLIIYGNKTVELEIETGRTWDPDYQRWFDSFEEWRSFWLGRCARHCGDDFDLQTDLPEEH
jgi:hypothetical protein